MIGFKNRLDNQTVKSLGLKVRTLIVIGGYSLSDVREAGYTACDLLAEGFSIRELREAGFDADAALWAEFDIHGALCAGYTPEEIASVKGIRPSHLIKAGVTAKQAAHACLKAFLNRPCAD